MNLTPVIAIFDIGKTNKKLFLFDENYQVVFEKSVHLVEVRDEGGFPCENLESLKSFIFGSLDEVLKLEQFQLKAINFSAYGASLVYIGEDGKPLTPLYNYLKPYPDTISDQLYKKYGGEEQFSMEAASPALGSLNSGLQLYRLKQEKPETFKGIKYALHLPQYLSFLLTDEYYSDLTSIGCHTALWDFNKNTYHKWVLQEAIDVKLAPIAPPSKAVPALYSSRNYQVGIGLHDSSAALIPYLLNFNEPFVLISTGTWNISLNPFNQTPLTNPELKNDCLCYMQYQGKPVKASRLFSGFEHEQQVKRIAQHFGQSADKYAAISYDAGIISRLKKDHPQPESDFFKKEPAFAARTLSDFKNDTEAYHQLMLDLIQIQSASTRLILQNNGVKRLFVDGGFSKNSIFMHLLADAFLGIEVFAASMAQASALGAALAIHDEWNTKTIPGDLVQLKHYPANRSDANDTGFILI
ncbi:MAG: carbohydrate kinase [Mucilaginibacter sp.]|nr:carbohydrate kinase [Mucilaginibacter sp.]